MYIVRIYIVFLVIIHNINYLTYLYIINVHYLPAWISFGSILFQVLMIVLNTCDFCVLFIKQLTRANHQNAHDKLIYN